MHIEIYYFIFKNNVELQHYSTDYLFISLLLLF